LISFRYALSAHFSAGFQGTRLGWTRTGTPLRQKTPTGAVIGESWEISDRPGDASIIANGPLAGKDLRWLMENHAPEILGGAKPAAEGRFPLLCKILDARDKLSLQVHPPTSKAAELKGDPRPKCGSSPTPRRTRACMSASSAA